MMPSETEIKTTVTGEDNVEQNDFLNKHKQVIENGNEDKHQENTITLSLTE